MRKYQFVTLAQRSRQIPRQNRRLAEENSALKQELQDTRSHYIERTETEFQRQISLLAYINYLQEGVYLQGVEYLEEKSNEHPKAYEKLLPNGLNYTVAMSKAYLDLCGVRTSSDLDEWLSLIQITTSRFRMTRRS